jgi:hypothetical protein
LPITAFRWFIEYGGHFGANWENRATFVVPATPAPYYPVLCAPYIQAPILMVIAPGDEVNGASETIARMAFDAIPNSKELFEIEGGHFGLLYYPSQIFNQASVAQRDFLLKHLQ